VDLLPSTGALLDLDDRALVAAAADIVAVPREAPADSFVLHAPLELLARALLLPRVPASARDAARARIAESASAFAAAGAPVEAPAAYAAASVETACTDLVAAMGAGDLDRVDAVAAWLDAHASPRQLRTGLGAAVVPSLAAAGHAPILLQLLPRVSGLGTNLLRGPCRELARGPEWRLRWFDGAPAGSAPLEDVERSLLDVPRLGVPGSDFIFPLMDQAERSGVAADLLGGLVGRDPDPARMARWLALVASWSMLQEPDDFVPYGWTHCLTMPQAVLDLAGDVGAERSAVVAATHVVGFRAALGSVTLVPDDGVEAPVPPAELVAFGAAHTDAHVVKHTLAALDAAAADPAHAAIHLAAAARLHRWWSA
jgi:hypothetical protein